MNRRLAVGILIVLILGLVFAVILSRQTTQTQQNASSVLNINTGSQVSDTNNLDGTMGPKNAIQNYSNTLSKDLVGTLTFSVTDPVFPTHIPTATIPPSGSNTSGGSDTLANGPQAVKSLVIKIKKIEVHLSQQQTNANESKNVDIWETLNMQLPTSVDLAQLTNGGIVNFTLTKLAAGKYSEVRVYVSDATAVLSNGQTVSLKIPDKNGVVRVLTNFSVISGRNTNIIMDFDAQQSVVGNGSNYLLMPFVSSVSENR